MSMTESESISTLTPARSPDSPVADRTGPFTRNTRSDECVIALRMISDDNERDASLDALRGVRSARVLT